MTTPTQLDTNRGGPTPPEHSGVCWASAVGAARHDIPLAGWDAALELAAGMLIDGRKECLCRRSKRGARQIR